jgi:hypothetical protein
MTDNISNVKTKKERLVQALKDYFKKNEDNHAESQIERLMHEIGGSYKEIEGMDWSANGKYQEGEGIFLLKFEDENFYAHIGQFRTGSYHTDFYYQDAYLQLLETEAEYNAPEEVYNFAFRNRTISFKSDNKAYITGHTHAFDSVNDAIECIVENRTSMLV